jgi:DNA-binding NtrC family response regulator
LSVSPSGLGIPHYGFVRRKYFDASNLRWHIHCCFAAFGSFKLGLRSVLEWIPEKRWVSVKRDSGIEATVGERMEADKWQAQGSSNRAIEYEKQSVLILNQNSAPCVAEKCDSLLDLLQKSLHVKYLQEQSANRALDELSPEPALILLRPSVGEAAEQLIQSCKEKWTNAPILAVLCARWDRVLKDSASVLTKVDDFLSCPFHESELLLRVRRLLQSKGTKAISLEKPGTNKALHFGALVGESECFVRAIKNIHPLAQSDATVLICGETGTGKELFARAIHYHSPRQNKPFIPVNCAALPDHLFENELFGHVKGAFTDASSSEKGLIAEAEGGTLILDEVDALSPAAQAKLLRFLQSGEYRPLGSPRSFTASVRIIAATNTDLFDRVKGKLFREDLYYRLNALSVTIPPLRERMEDIVHLCNHFLTQFARERNTERRDLSSDVLHKLMAYEWPGNVRELEGLILRALVLTTATTLQPEDINLPQQTLKPAQENARLRQAKITMIHNFELGYLTKLLAAHRGNITHAAKAAGKQRRALQRLLRKYDLKPQSFHALRFILLLTQVAFDL